MLFCNFWFSSIFFYCIKTGPFKPWIYIPARVNHHKSKFHFNGFVLWAHWNGIQFIYFKISLVYLIMLTFCLKVTRWLFWDRPCNVKGRSDIDNDTLSWKFLLHDGSSRESRFELATLRARNRHSVMRPPWFSFHIKKLNLKIDLFWRVCILE